MGHIDPRLAPARFLILGSASGGLLRQTSESLAGRMERVIIGGFSPIELGAEAEQRLWLRGGFPLSYWRKAMLIVLHGAGTSFKLFLSLTSFSGCTRSVSSPEAFLEHDSELSWTGMECG